MIRLILAGLRQRRLRAALTAIAILLGVAMVTGTLVLTSQITRAFDEIFQAANSGVDVRVSPYADFEGHGLSVPTLPESFVDRIAHVNGVRTAAPELAALGSPVVNGEYVQATGAPSFVFSLVPNPFRATQLASGRYPRTSGEVAVNEALAAAHGLAPGSRLGVATRTGVVPVTLTGTVTFANVSSIGGATIVIATKDDMQGWFDMRGRVNSVAVQAEPGVTPQVLARRVAAALPSTVEVRTGQQDAADQARQTTEAINTFLRPALLSFAVIALFVGAFIIFNTFSITVAQRLRELGLLRTIGASRRQVMVSVVGEALVIGLVAGIAGLCAGYGFARLLVWVFDTLLPGGIPVASAEISGGIVLTALLVGVLVSVLAALIPALRASRVPPVAALREGAEIPRGRLSRFAPLFAGLLGVGGIVMIVLGLGSEGEAMRRLLVMALGALLVFIAIGSLLRYLVPALARVIGWPLERTPGASGSLARRNATRNPARTAATAAALMIGIGLVSFVAVFAQGLKASVTDAIDSTLRGDLIISGKSFQAIPTGTVAAVRRTPGVSSVVAVYTDAARTDDGDRATVFGLDPAAAARGLSFEWVDGSQSALRDLHARSAVVEEEFAQGAGAAVGDEVAVRTASGGVVGYRVTGIYRDQILFNHGLITSEAGLDRIVDAVDPVFMLATVQAGRDPVAVQRAVATSLTPFPVAEVRTNAEYRDEIGNRVDAILYLLYVLLAMSIVISLFGIVNTLVLAITERTREIGMLRAIGLTRSQLRRMVRYESVITSGIGAVMGIILGVVLAWIFSLGLRDEGIVFRIPWVQLAIFLVLAMFAGVLAGVLPARRAARLDPLDALHYE